MTTNLPWKASLPFVVFSLRGQTEERWKRLLDRQCPVSKIFQRYIKGAKTYSALSFDRINFFNMANLFLVPRKAFVMCYCFRAPIKTFFFDACQKTVRPALLFPVPQNTKKPYNKRLISLVFSVRTVNYGSSFFSIDLWPKREIDGKKTRSVIYSTDRTLG